jgi:mRNA interferase MazF
MALPKKVKRGELWEADFTPQTYPAEPGKRGRPALVIQTDILNEAGHLTTLVIPGTSDIEPDAYPLRVFLGEIQKPGEAAKETDLLIDQIRAIDNQRFMGEKPLAVLSRLHMKRVEDAMKLVLF